MLKSKLSYGYSILIAACELATAAACSNVAHEGSLLEESDSGVETQAFASISTLAKTVSEAGGRQLETPVYIATRDVGSTTLIDVAPGAVLPGFKIIYETGPAHHSRWKRVSGDLRIPASESDVATFLETHASQNPGTLALWQLPRVVTAMGKGTNYPHRRSFINDQRASLGGDWSGGLAIPLAAAHDFVGDVLGKVSEASMAGDLQLYAALADNELGTLQRFFGTFSTQWGGRDALARYFIDEKRMVDKTITPTKNTQTRGWRTIGQRSDGTYAVVTETLTPTQIKDSKTGELTETMVRVRWDGGTPIAFHSDRKPDAPHSWQAQELWAALPEGFIAPWAPEPRVESLIAPNVPGMRAPAAAEIAALLQKNQRPNR